MSYKKNQKSPVVESEVGYDLYASKYDESRAYLNGFERDVFLKMIQPLKEKKVLDIGCGTGRTIELLKTYPMEITALDISEKMLKVVEKKFHDVKTVKADLNSLPFPDNTFDAVTAMFVIVHLKNLQVAFSEVYRVLKDGGVFILSNINQRKAPKLKLKDGKEIVIKSFYHLPKHVVGSLQEEAFKVEEDIFVYEGKTWINQVMKAIK